MRLKYSLKAPAHTDDSHDIYWNDCFYDMSMVGVTNWLKILRDGDIWSDTLPQDTTPRLDDKLKL